MYASYALARLVGESGIRVSLNGQGGDEVLAGYWQTYGLHLRDLALQGRWVELAGHLAGSLTAQGNPALLAELPRLLRRYRSRSSPRGRVRLRHPDDWRDSGILNQTMGLGPEERRVTELRWMFLPRLLKWEDRNSMAFSVEGRYPFLDHRLAETCLLFQPRLLYHYGWTKWPLRQGLREILPASVLRRRDKIGFEVPQATWLRNGLRPALEQWLRSDRPAWSWVERGDVQRLAARVWRSGSEEDGQTLFRIFMFDQWLHRFGVT